MSSKLYDKAMSVYGKAKEREWPYIPYVKIGSSEAGDGEWVVRVVSG